MTEILLPGAGGSLSRYQLVGSPRISKTCLPPKSRIAFAAAHVVVNPFVDLDIFSAAAVDWDATLSYRRYLWSLGLSVAEAMDTAQRGMGLDFENTKELIRRSVSEARAEGGGIACGAGTDQLQITPKLTLDDVLNAYAEQCAFIESVGGRIILMASRALAAVAKGPEDYARVYDAILQSVREPVILHWLGDMFDPALTGYWGNTSVDKAMDICLDVIRRNAAKIEGIKISLLDERLEVEIRRRLPESVKMFTGDDFNYTSLILGDGEYYSHALLGIFDAIAPLAAEALHALDAADPERFMELLAPTVPLSRHIFKKPTRFYKTGVVFLAYLNGHQSHFRMLQGLESSRTIVHLSELFVLADKASLLRDPDQAAEKMRHILATVGVF